MEDFAYLFLFISPFGAGFFWLRWYAPFLSDRLRLIRPNPLYWPIMAVPLVCAAIIFGILYTYSASDVQSDATYLLLYFALGLTWIGSGEWFFRMLGISAIFDVLERANPAAFFAVSGAFLGLTLCFSGGNIGEGPGPEAVFYAAGLASIAYGAVWWAYSAITQIDYAVTMHRDLASGVRLGGFLLAAGMILGRAAAGNWVSYAATLGDMIRFGSPVLLLLLFALAVERLASPTDEMPNRPVLTFGVLPALLFIAGALIWLSVGDFPI